MSDTSVEVYLKNNRSLVDAHTNLEAFFRFSNERRPHSALGDAASLTPMEVYRGEVQIELSARTRRKNPQTQYTGGGELRLPPQAPSLYLTYFPIRLSNPGRLLRPAYFVQKGQRADVLIGLYRECTLPQFEFKGPADLG